MRRTSDLCKGPQDVLENDKKHEKKRDHEWEQQTSDRLTENQAKICGTVGINKSNGRLIQNRKDKLFSCYDHEENASKDSKSLVEDL